MSFGEGHVVPTENWRILSYASTGGQHSRGNADKRAFLVCQLLLRDHASMT